MAQLEKELIFVRNAIYTEPEDQSAWLYQRYIFEQLLSYHDTEEEKLVSIREEMIYIDDLIELEPESKCIFLSRCTYEYIGALLAKVYFIRLKRKFISSENRISEEEELKIIDQLMAIDQFRKNYYYDLKRNTND